MFTRLARRHPIALFYALACGYSWIGFLLWYFSKAGLLPFAVPGEVPLLFEYGPTLAAVALTFAQAGRTGVKELLLCGLRWRVGLQWYAVVLFASPVIVLVTFGVRAVCGFPLPDWSQLGHFGERFTDHMQGLATPSIGVVAALVAFMRRGPASLAATAIVVAIMSGGVTEEFGWRGYLQPKLEERRSAFVASVVVGILWGLWHLAPVQLFVTSDLHTALVENGLWTFDYVLGGIPLAILFAWVRNNTRGSVLLPILFHASYNTTISTLFNAWPDFPHYWLKATFWVAALAVSFIYGPAHLRRSGKPDAEPAPLAERSASAA